MASMNELRIDLARTMLDQSQELRRQGRRCGIGSLPRERKFNEAAKLRREGLALLEQAGVVE